MPETRSRYAHLVPLVSLQVVGIACGIIGVRWSSSLVAPEVLGAFGLLTATHLFGVSVTHQGLVRHVQRFWTDGVSTGRYIDTVLKAGRRPTLWLAGGLAVVAFALQSMTGGTINATWWTWMLAVNILVVIAHLIHAALQAQQRYWSHFALSSVGAATRSFAPLIFASLTGASLISLGSGFAAHAILWVLAAIWFLRKTPDPHDAAELRSIPAPAEMLGPFMAAGLFGWAAGIAPRWIAALALTPEATGYFILAMNLAGVVPAAVTVVGNSYSFPALFAASRAGASGLALARMNDRAVVSVLVIGQIGLLGLAWAGPLLIGPVVHPRYAASMEWLLPTGGVALAAITSPLFCNVLVARNQPQACGWLTGWSAGFRIVAMGALAVLGDQQVFRWGFALLVWPTAAFEWYLTRWFLRRAG